jgi:hypothetical protein
MVHAGAHAPVSAAAPTAPLSPSPRGGAASSVAASSLPKLARRLQARSPAFHSSEEDSHSVDKTRRPPEMSSPGKARGAGAVNGVLSPSAATVTASAGSAAVGGTVTLRAPTSSPTSSPASFSQLSSPAHSSGGSGHSTGGLGTATAGTGAGARAQAPAAVAATPAARTLPPVVPMSATLSLGAIVARAAQLHSPSSAGSGAAARSFGQGLVAAPSPNAVAAASAAASVGASQRSSGVDSGRASGLDSAHATTGAPPASPGGAAGRPRNVAAEESASALTAPAPVSFLANVSTSSGSSSGGSAVEASRSREPLSRTAGVGQVGTAGVGQVGAPSGMTEPARSTVAGAAGALPAAAATAVAGQRLSPTTPVLSAGSAPPAAARGAPRGAAEMLDAARPASASAHALLARARSMPVLRANSSGSAGSLGARAPSPSMQPGGPSARFNALTAAAAADIDVDMPQVNGYAAGNVQGRHEFRKTTVLPSSTATVPTFAPGSPLDLALQGECRAA